MFRSLQRDSLGKISDSTRYTVQYLIHLLEHPQLAQDHVQQALDLGEIATKAVA